MSTPFRQTSGASRGGGGAAGGRLAARTLAAVLAAVLACTLAAPSAFAQRPSDVPSPPPYYAITDARIVPVSGPPIESGTVVIAEGLIQAVGANVQVPSEAWVIDGEGLTVYPGLIDGMSDLGLQRGGDGNGPDGGGSGPGTPPRGQGQGQERERAEGPEDRPSTTPWKSAADELSADDRRIETWREGGFTATLSAPGDGIVAGQGALIALAGDRREMVVKAPAALRLNLRSPGGFGDYPGSLFGVLSYLEQLFLDAERYAQAMEVYGSNPRGMKRPRYDRTLEPVHRAVAEGWAVLIPGNEAREIRRALELGTGIGARTVVYGAHEGHAAADELKAAGAAALVSLKWPEKSRDADPEAEESLRSLQMRAGAPTTPAALHAANVPFAFYAGQMATPRQALEAVRKAVEAGLPEEAALRALTLGPAEIYGVADRLGSLEPGKIANLVVTQGDLLDEDAKVRMVFIDGRKFEKREEDRPSEPPAAEVSGTYDVTVETRQGTQESTLELEMAEDGTLSGSLRGERGEGPITDGWVSGERFRFTVAVSREGRSFEAAYTGTVEGDVLEGTVSFGGRFSTEFRAVKRPGAGEGRQSSSKTTRKRST